MQKKRRLLFGAESLGALAYGIGFRVCVFGCPAQGLIVLLASGFCFRKVLLMDKICITTYQNPHGPCKIFSVHRRDTADIVGALAGVVDLF